MKNADHMLKEIIKTVDSNGDGKIQYEGGFSIPREAIWEDNIKVAHNRD